MYGKNINATKLNIKIIVNAKIRSLGFALMIGAIAAIGQTNLKRLIAYSSISHIGYALAGLATGSNDGIQSSIISVSYTHLTLPTKA